MRFLKIEGCGNHFVIVSSLDPVTAETARVMLEPTTGIGGDGLLVVRSFETGGGSAVLRVRVDMLNPDGSPMGMCGNGVRCVARYLRLTGHLQDCGEVTIEVGNRAVSCELLSNGLVRSDMGEPVFELDAIPVAAPALSANIEAGEACYDASFVSMGNPHCVIFLPEISESEARVAGPLIERHHMFPERANVSFCRAESRQRLRALVWERGAGLTAACGTGACACVVTGVRLGLCDRRAEVALPGGTVQVEWSAETNHVTLTGPAREIYWGELSESFAERCFGETTCKTAKSNHSAER